ARPGTTATPPFGQPDSRKQNVQVQPRASSDSTVLPFASSPTRVSCCPWWATSTQPPLLTGARATVFWPSRRATCVTEERASPNTATLPSAVGPTPLASFSSARPANRRCHSSLLEQVSESLAKATIRRRRRRARLSVRQRATSCTTCDTSASVGRRACASLKKLRISGLLASSISGFSLKTARPQVGEQRICLERGAATGQERV